MENSSATRHSRRKQAISFKREREKREKEKSDLHLAAVRKVIPHTITRAKETNKTRILIKHQSNPTEKGSDFAPPFSNTQHFKAKRTSSTKKATPLKNDRNENYIPPQPASNPNQHPYSSSKLPNNSRSIAGSASV